MPTNVNITTYAAKIRTVVGGSLASDNIRYIVSLYGTLSTGGSYAIYINFYIPGYTMPPNIAGTGQFTWNLPEAIYPSVMDMIRNEKPIYVTIDGLKADLFCGNEPAGAHEIGT